uniref:Ig-like domain-containing protein n=1 Tax=Myripristis murdjan TaxID=586833 RepID=A0A667X7G3_9TELE
TICVTCSFSPGLTNCSLFAGAEKQVYLADGGKLILESPIPAELKPLRRILWKYNGDMVVEWVEKLGSVEYYGAFQGHTTLDRKTARLEINDLTLIYSGVYSLELNDQLQSETYKVIVISKYRVSKPTVRVEPPFCSSTSSLCKLSCNGGIQEAEPISYSWRQDTGDWTESSKLMDITKNDNHVENFFCQMKNPVSEEESEPWKNEFYKGLSFTLHSKMNKSLTFCQHTHAGLAVWCY